MRAALNKVVQDCVASSSPTSFKSAAISTLDRAVASWRKSIELFSEEHFLQGGSSSAVNKQKIEQLLCLAETAREKIASGDFMDQLERNVTMQVTASELLVDLTALMEEL